MQGWCPRQVLWGRVAGRAPEISGFQEWEGVGAGRGTGEDSIREVSSNTEGKGVFGSPIYARDS